MTFDPSETVTGIRGVPDYSTLDFREPVHDVALVIPVLNENGRVLEQLHEIGLQKPAVDIVIADGGSTDGSTNPAVLKALGVTSLLTKFGAGRLSAQLRLAIHYCLARRFQAVITMDGNGKDGAAGIAAIDASLRSGCDFVQGSRFVRGGRAVNTPLSRYIAIRFVHAPLISLASHHWYTDTTNGFRGHSRRLLEDPRVDPLRDEFESYELLAYLPVRAAQLGFRVSEVPVTRAYPPGQATPTKIHGMRAHASLLRTLLKAARGDYAPSPR